MAELAAAGKPSILVPLPHAADQHQLRNAEAFAKAGAAVLVLDNDMDGGRLFEEVGKLRAAAGPAEAHGRAGPHFRASGRGPPRGRTCWRRRPPIDIACAKPKQYKIKMFFKPQHLHFIGIGGIGMSGIAEVLLNLGYQISGSDLKLSPTTDRLAQLGRAHLRGPRGRERRQRQGRGGQLRRRRNETPKSRKRAASRSR